jgi:four helix bundle protein
MRNFRNLLMWKKAMRIAHDVYIFSKSLPAKEVYGIRSQITRAAVPMPPNIAEGCSRKSNREFAHLPEIALGSSFELETQILMCESLNLREISKENTIPESLSDFQKMLNAYSGQIKIL